MPCFKNRKYRRKTKKYLKIKQNERLGWCLRPNLKNLSRGLKLRRGSNMVGST